MARTCTNGCPYQAFSQGLCNSCWKRAFGKPLARTAPVRSKPPIPVGRRKPIPKATKKRAKQLRQYAKSAPDFFENNRECAARFEGICTGWATQRHHKHGRRDEALNDPDNQLAICQACHDYELTHFEEALAAGVSERRNQPIHRP